MPDFINAFSALPNCVASKKIDEIPNKAIEIHLLDFHVDRDFSVLTTVGLSDFSLPVRAEENNEPYIELCFALPSYWDKSFSNENSAWVIGKLKQLTNFLLDKNTHFWDGHTIANSNPNKSFSSTMKQDFLLFSKALSYPAEFGEIIIDDKKIIPLFVVPIFKKELDFKMSRGTNALKKKLLENNASDILDDYRLPVIKKRFGIF